MTMMQLILRLDFCLPTLWYGCHEMRLTGNLLLYLYSLEDMQHNPVVMIVDDSVLLL